MQNIILNAKKGDRTAQKQLYDQLSPWCLGICRRYIKDPIYAEDIMITAFARFLQNLEQLKDNGTVEAWIKKIMVNECISFLRKKKIIFSEEISNFENHLVNHGNAIDEMTNQEIQTLIDDLPEGCKMVFNLYVFEDYTHKEIADTLNISEGPSKSQLAYARKNLKEAFTTLNKVHHASHY